MKLQSATLIEAHQLWTTSAAIAPWTILGFVGLDQVVKEAEA